MDGDSDSQFRDVEASQNSVEKYEGSRSESAESDGLALIKFPSNSLSTLFESGFSIPRVQLKRLIEGQPNFFSNRVPPRPGFISKVTLGVSESGNQNALIQELKSALKTVVDEIEILEKNCIQVETLYKETTQKAARELRKSMNVLYELQQKRVKLDAAEQENKKLSKLVM